MNKFLKFTPRERKVAYFSMEVGLSPEIPTYSGGLGVLAGDTLKSFADLEIPAVGVTLLSKQGYFHQGIDEDGNQVESPSHWEPNKHMVLLADKATLELEGRTIVVQAWVMEVDGITGFTVPVLFLDTDMEMNSGKDRALTHYLYGGDHRYRFMQEAILGIGGIRMLQILDHDNLEAYHMNEGHSALLALELMDRYQLDLDQVRELCVFTTHTPVPAGHDRFDISLVSQVLGGFINIDNLNHDNILDENRRLNLTYLALYHSNYINGVAQKHGETTRKMFPEYRIDAITNGIHTRSWASDAMAAVFDRHIPTWKNDPYTLRNVLNIPKAEIWDAHLAAKRKLIEFVNTTSQSIMDVDTLTIGFARRATAYKRADLLFSDVERLKRIAETAGGIQVVYGGKAHPRDDGGKELIRRIWQLVPQLGDKIKLVYLSNYDLPLAKVIVPGVDVWLNTPLKPMEASGTSGMKGALNGVVNFSVLDGWWIEGHIEDFTGWSIGEKPTPNGDSNNSHQDIEDLYDKLEKKILPTYYHNKNKWAEMMVYNIALNGSFFNTHRMVSQYVMAAYFQ